MAIVLHFKDGTSASLPDAAVVSPYPGDNKFIQCFNSSTPPGLLAFVPTESLNWAEGV